jgi:zinc-ribbon domain
MSRALKWILGILLGLVIVAVLAGLAIAVFGGFGYGMMRQGFRMVGPGYRMMGPYVYGMHNFSPLRSIFGALLGLGFLVLIIVGIVALINALVRSNRPAQTITPAQTTPPAQMASTEPTPAPTQTCSNCGKPVMEDWKNCPYCGNPLT